MTQHEVTQADLERLATRFPVFADLTSGLLGAITESQNPKTSFDAFSALQATLDAHREVFIPIFGDKQLFFYAYLAALGLGYWTEGDKQGGTFAMAIYSTNDPNRVMRLSAINVMPASGD